MSVCALVRSVLVSGVAVACLGASVSVAQAAPLNGGGAESSVASNVGSVSVVSLKDSDSGDVREADGSRAVPMPYYDFSDHGGTRCNVLSPCNGEPYKPGKAEKCVQNILGLGANFVLVFSGMKVTSKVIQAMLAAAGVSVSLPKAEDVYNKCFK